MCVNRGAVGRDEMPDPVPRGVVERKGGRRECWAIFEKSSKIVARRWNPGYVADIVGRDLLDDALEDGEVIEPDELLIGEVDQEAVRAKEIGTYDRLVDVCHLEPPGVFVVVDLEL